MIIKNHQVNSVKPFHQLLILNKNIHKVNQFKHLITNRIFQNQNNISLVLQFFLKIKLKKLVEVFI